MDDSFPRKFRRRDTSPEHPDKVFYQYKNGHEYWVTPERFEQNDALRIRLTAKWQKEHAEKRKKDYRKWLAKPGKLEIKRQSYKNWVKKPEGRLVRRKVSGRYRQTINGSLINRVRSRIAVALKRGYTKSSSTLELIGCSIEELKLHLESQFQDGMSWSNQNLWEIHHRIPLAYFDMNDPAEQKEAFSWRNQQPMWIEQHRSLNDRMDGELFRARDYGKMRQSKPTKIIPFRKTA